MTASSIAVLSHVPDPSIAVLRERAGLAGRDLVIYRAHLGELPDAGDHAAWVVLGGPQSAHADRDHFRPEVAALRDAVERNLPVLAICLGSQLLAEATGGRAHAGEHGLESGVIEVSSTSDAVPSGRYFSFHSDSMEAPAGAELLAKSERYLQAWRYGSALAVQFHPELDAAGFDAVLAFEADKLARFGVDVAALRADVAAPEASPTPSQRLLDSWLAGLPAHG
ncbi:type 1 glutamine amidotransferase [Nocardioides sp. GXZ039]|uniref:type 1 glutamine amidotransferase n=1 Tax=Nocardioides sp. GXZ039 TaxID=3136018 RepID=UPI0030F483D1